MSETGGVAAARAFRVVEVSPVAVTARYAHLKPGCYDEDDCPLEWCHVFVTRINGATRVFMGEVQADGDFVHHGAPTDLLGVVLLDQATGDQLFPPAA